jgi:rsbT co-antagonist protein RsbR
MSTARLPPLGERLAALRLSLLPVWVYDHDFGRFRWANGPALELWRAESEEELLARDFSSSSEATRTRLDNYLAALRRGQPVAEDWTLYPRGKPATMTLHGSGVELPDGRLAILFQAVLKETQLAPSMVRGVEALRHTSLMVSLLGPDGSALFHNPATLRAFGDTPTIAGWFGDEGRALLAAVDAGSVFSAEERARTVDGERWHAVQARPATDPVTGERAVLLQQVDVSERRQAEDLAATRSRLLEELNHTLAVVEQQRLQILALSAPVLDVGKSTLAVPLIGNVGAERISEIAQRLLPALQSQRARYIILDLTGCSELAESDARTLGQLARAIVLLGAQPILTGIGPQLARALIGSGTDLSGLPTLRTLRDAIEHCRVATSASGTTAAAPRRSPSQSAEPK